MPKDSLAVTHIIDSLINTELLSHTGEDGQIDTVGLRATVFLRLHAEHADAARAFTAIARDAALKARVDAILRNRKSDFLVGRAANQVKRGQLRMFVRFPIDEVNRFITKLRSHLLLHELTPFLAYHRKLRGAHTAEIKWGTWAQREMKSRRLPANAPVSLILDEDVAEAS